MSRQRNFFTELRQRWAFYSLFGLKTAPKKVARAVVKPLKAPSAARASRTGGEGGTCTSGATNTCCNRYIIDTGTRTSNCGTLGTRTKTITSW
jgi:hypothetical protein